MWSSEWQLWVVSGPQRLYQLNGRSWVQSGHPAGIFSNRKLNVRFREIAVVQLIRKIWNRTAAFGQTRSFKRSEKRCGEGQKTARSRRNKLSLKLARPDRRCAVRRFRWDRGPKTWLYDRWPQRIRSCSRRRLSCHCPEAGIDAGTA